MKLTRASSYALHAVAYMAQQQDASKPVASHKIALERGIPERFLLKVLKPLVSASVLLSIKGPNGGYRLARGPSDISMLEILEAVDGPIRGFAPFAEKSNPTLHSKLEHICNQSAEVVRKSLEKIRISELALKGPTEEEKPAREKPAREKPAKEKPAKDKPAARKKKPVEA